MKAVRSRKNNVVAGWTPHRDPRVWETVEVNSFGEVIEDVLEGETVNTALPTAGPAADKPKPKPKAKAKAKPKAKPKKAITAVTDAPLGDEELGDLLDELDT
tara:strand:- start:4971 stop:5276 length:306 start_codon:yes stop_codon:yes gene_type:complete